MKLEKLNKNHAYIMFGVAVLSALILSFFLGLITNENLFWLKQGLYSFLIGVIGVAFLLICKADAIKAINLNKKPNIIQSIVLCVMIFFLINGMAVINELLVNWLKESGIIINDGISMEKIKQNIVGAVIVVVIIAPIAEEIIFRGVIANGLNNSLGKTKAVLISGAMFSIFHMSIASTLHQFIIGITLAYFVLTTSSLYIGIIGHIFNNLVVLILGLFVSDSFYENNGVWISIVGILVFATIAVLIVLYNIKKAKAQKEIEQQQDTVTVVKTKSEAILLLVMGVLACVSITIVSMIK